LVGVGFLSKNISADFISEQYYKAADSKSVVIKPEVKLWQSTKEDKPGGSISPAQTASEYAQALGLATKAKRKNYTIRLKNQSWNEVKLGARQDIAWKQAVVRYLDDEKGAKNMRTDKAGASFI
jgi:hypothetical protein